ncbi:UBX domain-containing protein 6 [Halyomorpha halys]|uniref:UBX domain-containing protein 6 n=1 Tax=Halyomorpha halys TaxID=286706 RepID=UPI0006D51829|nr:uncharacterized protein LOC106678321 [Halyomorpha halys]
MRRRMSSKGNKQLRIKEEKESEKRSPTLPSQNLSMLSEEELMFRCTELGDQVLSFRDWKVKFRERLADLKEADDILAAVLTIKSLNTAKESEECVKVLEKYVRNLIDFPDNDKYRCIRLANPVLSEKVIGIEGGLDFLFAIGFKTALGGKDNAEPYLIYNPSKAIDLESMVKSLRSVTGFEMELDRCLKITHPKDDAKDEEVADEFYDWTLRDLKKEQKNRDEELEKNKELRSRAKTGEVGKEEHSYTRIRVKFPDGMAIEAIFSIKEKLYSLKSLLQSQFYFYDDFNFMALPSKVFNVLDEEKTFFELELYPTITLLLKWEMKSSGQKYVLKEKKQ